MSVPLSSSIATDFRRLPEPRTVARIGTELAKLWEVHVAREERGEQEFPELPPSAIQLGKWKYAAATAGVKTLMKPDYLCLQNGSALRYSVAAMAWEQKA